jgi:hypothetical protein
VQVALRVIDMCPFWCGQLGDGTCHSHGPLFDNVRLAAYSPTTAVTDGPPAPGYALHPNVPNPFNPVTTVEYDVPAGGGDIVVEVFDSAGRRVATLFDGHRAAGRWTASWNGRDDMNREVPSGVYFCRLVAGGERLTRKMVLLK